MTYAKQQTAIGLALIIFVYCSRSWAQVASPDILRDMDALKQEQLKMQRELQQVKASILSLRQQRQGSQAINIRDLEFSLGENNPTRGQITAPLALIEFSDYQ